MMQLENHSNGHEVFYFCNEEGSGRCFTFTKFLINVGIDPNYKVQSVIVVNDIWYERWNNVIKKLPMSIRKQFKFLNNNNTLSTLLDENPKFNHYFIKERKYSLIIDTLKTNNFCPKRAILVNGNWISGRLSTTQWFIVSTSQAMFLSGSDATFYRRAICTTQSAPHLQHQLCATKHYNFVGHVQDENIKPIHISEIVEKYQDHKRLSTQIEELSSKKNDTCAICYDNYDRPSMFMCCKNVSCKKCMQSWISGFDSPDCPFCRMAIRENNLYELLSVYPEQNTPNSLEQTLEGILKEIVRPDRFVMIFNSRNSYFNIPHSIERFVEVRSATTNSSIIRKFKRTPKAVLIVDNHKCFESTSLHFITDIVVFPSLVKEHYVKARMVVQRLLGVGRTVQLNCHFLES